MEAEPWFCPGTMAFLPGCLPMDWQNDRKSFFYYYQVWRNAWFLPCVFYGSAMDTPER